MRDEGREPFILPPSYFILPGPPCLPLSGDHTAQSYNLRETKPLEHVGWVERSDTHQ
jgi:hypothetical protein